MIKLTKTKQKGGALLISIIAMAAMFVIVFGSAYIVLVNTFKEISVGDQLRARYLSLAGAERLRYEVYENNYDLNIDCQSIPTLFSYQVDANSSYDIYCEEVGGENLFYSKAIYKGSFNITPITFPPDCGGEFVDDRDGQTYQTVQIGDQCWMAENLNYDDGCSVVIWVNETDAGWCGCYDDSATNCDTNGRLYQWSAAMDKSTIEGAQGICPIGWHIPTDEELKILEGTVDSTYGVADLEWDETSWRGYDAGTKLKAVDSGTLTWGGDDSFGFTALPSGKKDVYGSYASIGTDAYIWTSSMLPDSFSTWFRYFNASNSTIGRRSYLDPVDAYSVRCIKDN